MTLPIAILAGGLAKRLRPLTEQIPKSLVTVAGRPFIDHQLALLRAHGYSHVVLCLGYLGEMVRTHIGDGARWAMKLDYAFDGEELLGTGGALRKALPLLGDKFLVLYGDSYLLCDFHAVEAAFLQSRAPALMTVYRNEDRWDKSNVVYANGWVARYDKKSRSPDMQYIDYGLGAMYANAIAGSPPESGFDLSDTYGALAAEGRLAGLEVHERFYEIGSLAGHHELDAFLSAKLNCGSMR